MSQQKKGKKGARPSQGGPESTPSKDPGPRLIVDVKEEHKEALSVKGMSQQEIVDKIEAKLARPRGRPKGGDKDTINLSLDKWIIEILRTDGEKAREKDPKAGPSSIANAILARSMRARRKPA